MSKRNTNKKGCGCGCKTLNNSIHTFCTGNCGCKRLGIDCSTGNCLCNGICANGKSISDVLFFKVWRNKVIRNAITGDEILINIVKLKELKKLVIIECDRIGIVYNERTMYPFIKSFKTVDEIMEIETSRLKELRKQLLIDILENRQLKYRNGNSGFLNFVNCINVKKVNRLPPISIAIDHEIQYQARKLQLRLELDDNGLIIRKTNQQFKQYLNSGVFPIGDGIYNLKQLVQHEVTFLSLENNTSALARRDLVVYALRKQKVLLILNERIISYIQGDQNSVWSEHSFNCHIRFQVYLYNEFIKQRFIVLPSSQPSPTQN